jgi:hypothetical protein
MKRLAEAAVIVAAVIGLLTGGAGAAQRPAADTAGSAIKDTLKEFIGTWHGTAAGREMGGGGVTQRARFALQPDGKWTLSTGGTQSEGTISRVAGGVLELDGRFVPDGAPAGARLERVGDTLTGSASSRFFGSPVNIIVHLERERADSVQTPSTRPTTTASKFEAGQFAGTWQGTAAGREMGGGGVTQRARFALQPDGKWTLSTGGTQSEGTISRVAGGLLELEGRFVPDGAPAGARLERVGDTLVGTVTSRFFGSTVNASVHLERERADSLQALPIQQSATVSPFQGDQILQSP